MQQTIVEPMKVAVVIPAYKVEAHILALIPRIGPEVDQIFVVDDRCPNHSGKLVQGQCTDQRVQVIFNDVNQGVGGAVMAGYRAAIAAGCDVIVKVDGDGQMDPALIPEFIRPIILGNADYTKGNRFFNLEDVSQMPGLRIFGNAALSFMAKFSTGYWRNFDPTNGFTAIHAKIAACLPMNKISRRYFFETDLMFRLNTLRAVVVDIPMAAFYGDEVSNLKIRHILGEFLLKHLRNACKRIFYSYYLRDMSAASLELPLGLILLLWGGLYGTAHWLHGLAHDTTTPAGTVMLAALPVILGVQLVLGFLNYDVANVPTDPIHPRLGLATSQTIRGEQ